MTGTGYWIGKKTSKRLKNIILQNFLNNEKENGTTASNINDITTSSNINDISNDGNFSLNESEDNDVSREEEETSFTQPSPKVGRHVRFNEDLVCSDHGNLFIYLFYFTILNYLWKNSEF